MQDGDSTVTGPGRALLRSKPAQVGEIVALFVVALAVIGLVGPLAGENHIAGQGVVWVANVLMLVTVWLGLRLRGQGWAHFGLSFRRASRRIVVRAVSASLVVFVAAIAAFVVGAIVMANIVGIPEGADMSGYNYLRGNLPMLILALVAVYIVSSFGEEVIYRAFLINRIAELGGGGKAAWRMAVLISSVVFGFAHYGGGQRHRADRFHGIGVGGVVPRRGAESLGDDSRARIHGHDSDGTDVLRLRGDGLSITLVHTRDHR